MLVQFIHSRAKTELLTAGTKGSHRPTTNPMFRAKSATNSAQWAHNRFRQNRSYVRWGDKLDYQFEVKNLANYTHEEFASFSSFMKFLY